MGRAVLLEHNLPDGSSHYDWMIQRSPGEGLVTFRVRERIDRPGLSRFEAERLGEHRQAYLDYEGPVSGDRGSVRRIARGTLTVLHDADGRFECEGELGEAQGRFAGRQVAGAAWMFQVGRAVK